MGGQEQSKKARKAITKKIGKYKVRVKQLKRLIEKQERKARRKKKKAKRRKKTGADPPKTPPGGPSNSNDKEGTFEFPALSPGARIGIGVHSFTFKVVRVWPHQPAWHLGI